MYKCEQCGKDHDGTYGSGRFCCRSCSNRWVALNQSSEAKARKIEKGKSNLIPHSENLVQYRDTGISHSERMRRVMSNPQIRKKISDKLVGRTLSEESRYKISKKVRLSHIDGRNKGWTTRKNQESYAEKFWKTVLDNNGITYQQEYKVNKPGPGCYFLDFLLQGNVDLEIDGHQHYEESRKVKDEVRDEYLKSLGYVVYRIKYVNPSNSLKVKEDIERFLSWYEEVLNIHI